MYIVTRMINQPSVWPHFTANKTSELLVWGSHWLRAGYYFEGFVLHLGLVEEFNIISSVAALIVCLFEKTGLCI